MKRFLLLTLSMLAVCLLLLAVCFIMLPVGRIGDIYPRIVTPRQQSLVLGTSRAAQAINPAILDSTLADIYSPGIYNFSFHIDLSTYNEQYARATRLKLAPSDGQRNWFILTVDPWALKGDLEETNELRLRSVSRRPNLEFLCKHFQRGWFSPLPTHCYVNKRGRTEIDYKPQSERDRQRHIAQKMITYEQMAQSYAYSKASELVLDSLIADLLSRGDVYLVRIPTSGAMLRIENRVCPDFSERMTRLARRHNVSFLDFTADTTFVTNDGNHLIQTEGNRFSLLLARAIRGVVQSDK